MQENFNMFTSEITRHAMIAFMAGIAHALQNGDTRKELGRWERVGEFIASTLIASFSGVIFGLLALSYFGGESYMTLAITGSGGFVGAKGLKMISEALVIAVRSIIAKK